MAINLLQDDMNQAMKKSLTPPGSRGINLLREDMRPKESLGASVAMAIPRAGEDIIKGAYQTLRGIPQKYRDIKQGTPELADAISQHPGGIAKQFGAGISELGQGIFNMPHDFSNYLTNRLHLVPEDVNKKIQMARMPDSSQEINATFGVPSSPGEQHARGIGRDAEKILGLGGLATGIAKTGLNAIRPINAEKVAKSIQKSHDTLHSSAVQDFKNVEKGAYNRNVGMVPLRKDLISDIGDHPLIPKSKKVADVLNKAHSGDYSGLRELQSELFQRGTKAVRSPLVSEANAGESLFDLRDEINDSVKNHLINTGNIDLADMLGEGVGKYKLLKDTYYHKKTPGAIKNLVDPENRKIPKKMMEVLSQESKPMNRVKKENPFAAKKSEQYKSKQKSIGAIKKAGWAAGTLGIGTSLYKLLSGNEGN